MKTYWRHTRNATQASGIGHLIFPHNCQDVFHSLCTPQKVENSQQWHHALGSEYLIKKSNKPRLVCLVQVHCCTCTKSYNLLNSKQRQQKIDSIKQDWRHYLLFWLVRPHGIPNWTHPILCLLERPTNVLNYWIKEHDERSSPHNYLYKIETFD